MKEIKDILDEKRKMSTGIFKDEYNRIYYLLNGDYHRLKGPAIKGSDCEYWCLHNYFHRDNGPAVQHPNRTKSWYYYGVYASTELLFWDPEWRKRVEIERFL